MVWLKALTGLFTLLDKLFAFVRDRELKQAGANEEKLKQVEVENEDRAKARAKKDEVLNLDSATVRHKLRKYTRK